MARRTGLREFQLSVAERIRTAASRTALSSKLGFQVGAENWFVSLSQVNEVIPVPPIVAVPLTHSWFRGVANVRGNLYSVLDFSAFKGGDATPAGGERRVILVSDRLVGGAGCWSRACWGFATPNNSRPFRGRPTRPRGSPACTRTPARHAGSSSICPPSFASSGSWK
jgi:Chemotaxis signal transduction protein